MRVLHVLPGARGGGAEHFVTQLLPALGSETDITVSLLTLYPSRDEDLRALGTIALKPVNRSGRLDVRFLPRLIATMRSWKPDIVHTHGFYGKVWGRLAAVFASVPTIVHTAHNPCDPQRSLQERVMEPMLNAKTAAMVTFFESQRTVLSKLERFPIERIAVIPNAVAGYIEPHTGARTEARGQLGLRNDEIAIFVVGRLQRVKNQRLAIEAMRFLPPGLARRVKLFCIGSGPDASLLNELIREWSLEERVLLTGFRNDLQTLLHAADLLLSPSLSEGMPLAILEAMIAGVPVATTPWIGAADLLDNGRLGVIAEDWDPRSLATRLSGLMVERQKLSALADAARTRALRQYDLATAAKRHRELYNRLTADCDTDPVIA